MSSFAYGNNIFPGSDAYAFIIGNMKLILPNYNNHVDNFRSQRY